MNTDALVHSLVAAVSYSLVGVLIFLAAFFVIAKVVPFSIRKEIEEDQNVALGIIVGSIIMGLAWIVAAAVHG